MKRDQLVRCIDVGPFARALTEGKEYVVRSVVGSPSGDLIRVVQDDGRLCAYYKTRFELVDGSPRPMPPRSACLNLRQHAARDTCKSLDFHGQTLGKMQALLRNRLSRMTFDLESCRHLEAAIDKVHAATEALQDASEFIATRAELNPEASIPPANRKE